MFANSETNLALLHTMFPSVSSITSGKGEFIKLVFAAVSTFNGVVTIYYY